MSLATLVRVLLVDDHPALRLGMRRALEETSRFEVVGEAGTGHEALRIVAETLPDIVVVDLRLPDADGVEIVREIRSRHPQTRCMVLTHFGDDDAFCQTVLAGASGYVVKHVPIDQIVDAVGRVADGRSTVLGHSPGRVPGPQDGADVEEDVLENLTPQERRIFALVARGLTNREIASELTLAEKTVRNYISNAFSKVGMRNRTEVAAYIGRMNGSRHVRPTVAGTRPSRRG